MYYVVFLHSLNRVGADFVNQIYTAGGDVLAGRATWLTRQVSAVYTTAPYPPPVVLALAPFSELPESLAIGLWVALLAVAALAVLPLLAVRDRRCQILWLTSPPVVVGLYYGNITLLLVLALALMWRVRDRPGLCAAAATAMAIVKLWPIAFALWMWLTGRRRAAIYTLVATVVLVLSAWAVIGMRGLVRYPSTLNAFSERFASRGYSIVSLLVHADVSIGRATVAAALMSIALLVGAARADERVSLLLFVAAGLAASTIVWLHYLGFFIVPIAALAPRFGLLWFYLPGLWLSADLFAAWRQPSGAAAAVAITTFFVVLAIRRSGQQVDPAARAVPMGRSA